MSSRLLKKYEKNVTVQSLHLLVSIFMKTRSMVVHHMLICMRKRLCKQACNTLFHTNQRMTEL